MTHHDPRIALKLGALLLALSPVAPAQDWVRGEQVDFHIKNLGNAPADAFTRTLVGHFSAEPQADVAFLRDEQVIILTGPASFDAALRVPEPTPVTAIGRRILSGRNEVLVCANDGLIIWTHSESTGDLDGSPYGRIAYWQNALWVGAGQLDRQHGQDFYGIRSNGNQAIILLAAASGFQIDTLFSIAPGAQEITHCDFAGDGLPELVVTTPNGVYVYAIDGTPITSFLTSGSKSVTAFPLDDGTSRERIVWVVDPAPGMGSIQIIGTNGGSSPVQLQSLPLGAIVPVAVAAGDLDGDGDKDLALSQRSSHDVLLIENTSTGYDLGSVVTVPLGPAGSAPTNSAHPAIGDLDNDGDLDVFFPVQSSGRAVLFKNHLVEERLQTPALSGSVLYSSGYPTETSPYTGFLNIHLVDSPQIPSGATHVEVMAWRKNGLASSTDPAATNLFRAPISSGPNYDAGQFIFENPDSSVVFWLQRYVELEAGTENYVQAFPGRTFAFVPEWTEADDSLKPLLLYLEGLGASYHSDTEPNLAAELGFVIQVNRTVTTVVDIEPIPDYEDDEEPETPPGGGN
ncbi:MAG: FG-GAP-like repeat-containing protein [Planctomycetota bacterium]